MTLLTLSRRGRPVHNAYLHFLILLSFYRRHYPFFKITWEKEGGHRLMMADAVIPNTCVTLILPRVFLNTFSNVFVFVTFLCVLVSFFWCVYLYRVVPKRICIYINVFFLYVLFFARTKGEKVLGGRDVVTVWRDVGRFCIAFALASWQKEIFSMLVLRNSSYTHTVFWILWQNSGYSFYFFGA